MTWEEVKNSVSQWLWDNDEHTYFWILNTDESTKTVHARGFSGLETDLFYSSSRFFRNALSNEVLI